MLYSCGAILMAWADPVLRNVAKQTGELRIGLLVHRLGDGKLYRVLRLVD
jgi:hypothetical protein